MLIPRCANRENVFVAGHVYFTDADCYARMTRVRICAEHPGTVVRHHDFENFPSGTVPHTTAPLDYLILLLALALKPFTAQPIDVAGAFVGPLLAVGCSWFLWWWLRRMKMRYGWVALLLFSLSPILVHGTELGRPDHQALTIVAITIALCAEWTLQVAPTRFWSLTSGIAWGIALWVSLYEPLVLLGLVLLVYAVSDRRQLTSQIRRSEWIALVIILAIAFAVEQRIPAFPFFGTNSALTNWARTIGELMPVRITDPVWLQWCGWMLVAMPLLVAFAWWRKKSDGLSSRVLPMLTILLAASYVLTLWQARWGYFFALLFALTLPLLLEPLKSRLVVWAVVIVSFFPILQYWDAQIWPNESELARRTEARREAIELRALAERIRSSAKEAFLAPWWLSPAIAYWSGQPGIAGSSHESLPGIIDSARFCLTSDENAARELLREKNVSWVFVYDSDRSLRNSAAILNNAHPAGTPWARA